MPLHAAGAACHRSGMTASPLQHAQEAIASDPTEAMRSALLEALYCDMLVLADEVRSGDQLAESGEGRPQARAEARILYACGALRLSARIMRMTQILLDLRGGKAGHAAERFLAESAGPASGEAPPVSPALAGQHAQAERLEVRLRDLLRGPDFLQPPVRDWQNMLTRQFT